MEEGTAADPRHALGFASGEHARDLPRHSVEGSTPAAANTNAAKRAHYGGEYEWPHLVGLTAEEATAAIRASRRDLPRLAVLPVPELRAPLSDELVSPGRGGLAGEAGSAYGPGAGTGAGGAAPQAATMSGPGGAGGGSGIGVAAGMQRLLPREGGGMPSPPPRALDRTPSDLRVRLHVDASGVVLSTPHID